MSSMSSGSDNDRANNVSNVNNISKPGLFNYALEQWNKNRDSEEEEIEERRIFHFEHQQEIFGFEEFCDKMPPVEVADELEQSRSEIQMVVKKKMRRNKARCSFKISSPRRVGLKKAKQRSAAKGGKMQSDTKFVNQMRDF